MDDNKPCGESAVRAGSNANKILVRLDRYAAWLLMAVIIVYAISGYGMTKGLFDRDTARSLHLSWLGGVGIVAFVIHSFWGLRLSFVRKCLWNKYTKFLLVSFYTVLIVFFAYVHFFYVSADSVKKPVFSTSAAIIPITRQASFTAATLAPYNGLNGQPAYVAVDGVVYDVSSVYRDGKHHGYGAGVDLTELFYAQHQKGLLLDYQIVGIYQP